MLRSIPERLRRPGPPSGHAVGALVFGLAAVCLAPAEAFARRQGPPVNACGLPVRDALGRPLLYGRAQMSGCQPKAAPRSSQHEPPTAVTALRAYGSFGTAIGASAAVLDGGEIYVGGSSSILFGPNDYWYALRHVRGTRGYEQVFVSRRLPRIAAFGVADVSGDGRKEVVVAQDDGRVVLFDQRSRVEITTLTVAAFNVVAMSLSDLDGDQKAEILLTTGLMGGNMLYVLTGGGALLWQLAGAGGELAVGNMDRDRSLEIATAAGPVIDWESRTVQWQRPQQGLAVDLAAGDFDGDGMDELIVADYWDFIFAFDVDTQSPKWSLYSFNTNVIWLGHADADPALELLVGEAQWGEVLAYDAATLALEWAIVNPEHGTTFLTVGDPNRDGILDVLWGAGGSSSGPDRLYVANLATHTIDWENVQLDGPFLPPERGDIDGDGLAEIVTASTSSDAGYRGGRIVVLDPSTLRLRALSQPVADDSVKGLHDLRLRNVDDDPELEIVVAADRHYNGLIEIYDFTGPTSTFTLKWANPVRPYGALFYSVEVADVDADGRLEVVGGVGVGHTDWEGPIVYVYSYPDGTEEWRSPPLTTTFSPIDGLLVLTAGGGAADVVAMVKGETLNFFSGRGLPRGIVSGPYSFLGPDGSSTGRSFLAGTDAGEVRQYQRRGHAYDVTWSRGLGCPAVDGVGMLSTGEMAVACGGHLALYSQRDAPAHWRSEDYGVHGAATVGAGPTRRPLAGGSYALVSLAPWTTLVDVWPRSGPSYGGTLLTVFGTSFDPAAQLYVGARPAFGTQILGPTLATGTTPALPRCSLNTVTVVNPDMSFEVLEGAFRARQPGCVFPEAWTAAPAIEPASR